MHILQINAKKTKIIETIYPDNAIYNFIEGVWRDNKGGLVTYDIRRPMCTKKEDIETGEDQKGQ